MMPKPPTPRVDEARDVLVERQGITYIKVLSPDRSETTKRLVWTVWIRQEKKDQFASKEEARTCAAQIAKAAALPAWIREDANYPWEAID